SLCLWLPPARLKLRLSTFLEPSDRGRTAPREVRGCPRRLRARAPAHPQSDSAHRPHRRESRAPVEETKQIFEIPWPDRSCAPCPAGVGTGPPAPHEGHTC